MTHEIILKMIEEVSPDDTAKMDEIDRLVSEYLPTKNSACFDCGWGTIISQKSYHGDNGTVQVVPFTRSRDALKAVRPNKQMMLTQSISGYWGCDIRKYPLEDEWFIGIAPTEELAELHAILQAIAHERKQADPPKEGE